LTSLLEQGVYFLETFSAQILEKVNANKSP
jgi:hypothetical protein